MKIFDNGSDTTNDDLLAFPFLVDYRKESSSHRRRLCKLSMSLSAWRCVLAEPYSVVSPERHCWWETDSDDPVGNTLS